MVYEIWNLPTRNLIATFATEQEAVAAIRKMAERHGIGYLTHLALTRENEDGRTTQLAVGVELMRYWPQYA